MDAIIHRKLFGQESENGAAPPYSTDTSESSKIRSKLKSKFGHPIVIGKTKMAAKPHFARFDSDPSTATEVLAESESLALCRLALLLLKRF